ncbi:MAG: DNA cytosine methyltransferase [Desulfobacterales bacterium]
MSVIRTGEAESVQYVRKINQLLQPKADLPWKVLDLFAGCGGLSLGFEAAGFQTIGYEMDSSAAQTCNRNLKGTCFTQKLTLETVLDTDTDVIIGGPPCQPFSVGGYQKGIADDRNGFPLFVNAVKQIKPELWMFENVRGMLYANRWYLDEIIQELREEGYDIEYKLLNAVNYGVPQNRERVFAVGHRRKFYFPLPERRKITAGEAVGDLTDRIQDESKILTASMDQYVAKYEKASCCITPRDLHPDKPARTLTCRNIAAPTGDMQRVKLKDGRRRRISVTEAARLQSFPDWFEFMGTETEQYYQIGNAVPPMLAYHLACSVKKYMENSGWDDTGFMPVPQMAGQMAIF